MEKVIEKFGVKNIYPDMIKPSDEDMNPIVLAVKNFKKKISAGIARSMKKVIEQLGLGNNDPNLIKPPQKKMTPLESATLKFQADISVGIAKNSDVIEISFRVRGKNPCRVAHFGAVDILPPEFHQKACFCLVGR